MKSLKVLGLIPARGGSKGVPGKNIRLLCGKPLIAHTVTEALKSKWLSRVILSSDDDSIIRVVREYGGEAPFVRPAELATDASLVIDTVKHAVEFVEREEGALYDYVVLLQPTSPMRVAADIDEAFEKIVSAGADSLISVTEVGAVHPARMKRIVGGRLEDILDEGMTFVPKQALPKMYILNGAIYIARRDVIFGRSSFYGKDRLAFVMPPERSVNIDTELDLVVASVLMGGKQ